MNPSEKDQVSLDEKIALIRKKNEMIIRRKQIIEKEIEVAKKHNAMVDVCAPKYFDDDKPTLYSDTIPKSRREERKRSVPDKVNYKPRSNNAKEDAAWKAERNEIDRERIRRQRADSGWRREWDADKDVPDHEFLRENNDRRGHSKEISHTRSSHTQNVSGERPELPVLTRQNQYYSKPSDVSVERSELRVSTRQNQQKSKENDVSVEQSEKPVPRRNQSRGRGRPVVSADNLKITQNLRRTVNVEPSNFKQEKAPLKKRVSWGSENELIENRRISLKDDRLKNIKVKVNSVDSNIKNRSIEITEERGPLIKEESKLKFDEKTSLNIKDCVAKASLDKTRLNRYEKDAAPLPKPKESSLAKLEPNPIIKSNVLTVQETSVVASVSAAELPSKEGADTGDDEEWEDLSGEDWESASDDE